jgi:hypothetical protein
MPEMSLDSSAARHTADARPKRIRSAVSNGRRLFVDGNGNTAWSRRYRDLIVGHVSDLGGRDMLSEAQLSLIKRASTLELELEQAEGRLSKGEQIDLDCYGRAASHLRRILESLGLERKPRNIVRRWAIYCGPITSDDRWRARDDCRRARHVACGACALAC